MYFFIVVMTIGSRKRSRKDTRKGLRKDLRNDLNRAPGSTALSPGIRYDVLRCHGAHWWSAGGSLVVIMLRNVKVFTKVSTNDERNVQHL